jgi:hypothetical protein
VDGEYCTEDAHLESDVVDLNNKSDDIDLWCTRCNRKVET